MARSLNRRAFLKRAGVASAAVVGAPLISSTRPARAATGHRLVVAVGQWGTETPFAWRTVQAEKPLWDCIYDPLIQRDPKTFEYRPGLATEWKPSNELKTWTFKLRSGVKFHEGWGELTAEDVKFTVEQNLKPDAGGGSSPFFRMAARPHRDARQAHGRHALQESRVGGALTLHAVRRLPEHRPKKIS